MEGDESSQSGEKHLFEERMGIQIFHLQPWEMRGNHLRGGESGTDL
jgi:hypothetical protein